MIKQSTRRSRFLGMLLLCACGGLSMLSVAATRNELVVVFGASGGTGSLTLPLLTARGFRVRAVARDPDKLRAALGSSAVEVVRGDVRDSASVAAALQGADRAIVSIGGGSGRTDPTNNSGNVDDTGVRTLAAAARAAGLKQVVLLSSITVTRAEQAERPAMRKILADKLRGENALRNSGVTYTIIRPGELLDDAGDREAIRVGQGDTMQSRIQRADLARVCVEALGERLVFNTTFEVTGEPGAPPRDWRRVFRGLKPDAQR